MTLTPALFGQEEHQDSEQKDSNGTLPRFATYHSSTHVAVPTNANLAFSMLWSSPVSP